MVIGIDCSRAFVQDRTGTENYSYSLIKEILGLPASSTHHFVLFVRPNAVLPSWLSQYRNIEVVEIKYRYLWTQAGLAMATWGAKLDVLWIPAHTLPILRKPKLATVVTIHGLEYQWLPEYKNLLQRWYLPLSTKYAASRATRLIAVSKFTKNQLIKQLHTNPKKIKVVYEGVDVGVSVSRRVGVSVGKGKYILFVGSLQPRKNLIALVEAFSLLEGDYLDYRLVIAGGRGWMTEEIYQAPSRYGVQERVVFAGRVSDDELAKLYQRASLYVQPSLTEGFGLPILEAMEWGVPVVSSDGGALPEVVDHAGVVVQLGNRKQDDSDKSKKRFVRDLAAAIAKVLSSDEQRAKMKREGKKRVSELSWQKAAIETLKAITEAAN